MDRDSIIRSYVERITALEAARRNRLTSADLRDLARDLGMSDDDLAAAESTRRAHIDRAAGHVRYSQWDDAITELREALAYDPLDVDTLHTLALAHQGRWKKSGNQGDREEARAFSRRVLELDPRHDPSFALLGEIDRPSPAGDVKRRRALGFFLPLVLICLIALALIVALNSGPELPPLPPQPPPLPGEVQQQVIPEFEVNEPENLVEGIPVELESTALSSGLSFAPTRSASSQYGYQLEGTIYSNRPLFSIELKCEVLDRSGELIRSKNVVIPSSGATTLPFELRTGELDRDVHSVKIWVKHLDDGSR